MQGLFSHFWNLII